MRAGSQQALKLRRHLEHQRIVVTPPDNLQANRQTR
jgi:hypothetical protein